MRRRRADNPAGRLRAAVEALPERTKRAMLRGIERNRIIVGAYVDPRSGGVCPMLAAHRNGGRTSVASFAVAWDAYTAARRPRRATTREVRALRAMLEASLADGATPAQGSIAELAAQIRAEREQLGRCTRPGPAAAPVEPVALPEPVIRIRRLRPAPPAGIDLLAAVERELAGGRPVTAPRRGA